MKFVAKGRTSHQLDVILSGEETFRSPAANLVYMTGNTHAEPETGRLSGLRRLISDTFIPMVRYSSESDSCTVTVAPLWMGEIFDLDISAEKWIVQKEAVLGAGDGVEISKYSEEHLSDPRLGRDGMTLAELSGSGTAFVSSMGDGTVLELRPEQHYTAAAVRTVGWMSSVKAKLYDADGWENVSLVDFKGPGRIILQGLCPRRHSLLENGPDGGRELL
ncbi:MAG: hypothetical protein A3Q59_01950 [Methanomethylophilus alvi]|nr:MAG: hypothetical protein A3Q59_01950 [Methanomethylophilus alvi]